MYGVWRTLKPVDISSDLIERDRQPMQLSEIRKRKVISSVSSCALLVYSWLFCSIFDTCHVILEYVWKGSAARGMTHFHIEVFFPPSFTQSRPDRSHLPGLIYRFLQSSSLLPMNNSNAVSRCELADVITTTPVSSVFTGKGWLFQDDVIKICPVSKMTNIIIFS